MMNTKDLVRHMERLEENEMAINEMTKRAKRKPVGTYEEMMTFQLGAIATMLTDISKSLAIIADKTESEGKQGERIPEYDCDNLRELPPVNPQKTGYWIYDKNIENWRCSECGETPKTLGYCGTADFMAEHFKYCNHCGIRMLSQESEEV